MLPESEDLGLADAERVDPVADVLERLVHHVARGAGGADRITDDAALEVEPEHRLQGARREPDQRGHDEDTRRR